MDDLILKKQLQNLIINRHKSIYRISEPNIKYFMNVLGTLFKFDTESKKKTVITLSEIPINKNDKWCFETIKQYYL